MFRRHYNLLLMAIWAVIGVALIAPETVLPAKVQQQFRAPGGPLAGALALMFAAYNFVRWWAYQSLYRTRRTEPLNPLEVRRPDLEGDDERYLPNPELDFTKPADVGEPTPPPRPSVNGDHK